MEIYQIKYTKAHLDRAPENERNFHLLAGQAANDLNILTKLISQTLMSENSTDVEERASTAMAMLLIKTLAGRLNEVWLTISDVFNPIYRSYESDLSDGTKGALKEIKKYFGKSNLIHMLRNNFSNHADSEIMKKGYDDFDPSEIFIDYVSVIYRGQALFYSSEMVSVLAMTKLSPGTDWKTSINNIAVETTKIAHAVGEFLLGYMEAFMKKYLSHTNPDFEESKIVLKDIRIDEAVIPFFCNPPLSGVAK